MGAQRERVPADRVLAPLPWLVARDEIDADAGLGMLRPIVGAAREDASRCQLSDLDAVGLGAPVTHGAEIVDERLVEIGLL